MSFKWRAPTVWVGNSRVHVAYGAIRQQIEDRYGSALLIVVPEDQRPSDGTIDKVEADLVDEAQWLANETSPGRWVYASQLSPTPRGAVVDLDDTYGPDLDARWLDTFATALALGGFRGAVRPLRQPRSVTPDWVEHLAPPDHGWLCLIAGLQRERFRSRDDRPTWDNGFRLWNVDPAVTHAVMSNSAAWGPMPHLDLGRVGLNRAVMEMGATDVTSVLESALQPGLSNDYFWGHVRAAWAREETHHVRMVKTNHQGEIHWGVLRRDRNWQASLDELRPLLAPHARRFDLAFVRSTGYPSTLDIPVREEYRFPYLSGRVFTMLRHRWAERLPDIHGIQVITRAHLQGAGDLTGWTLTPLDADHWVLEANDLEPWYGSPTPDSDTLDDARRTHEGMIATADDWDLDEPMSRYP